MEINGGLVIGQSLPNIIKFPNLIAYYTYQNFIFLFSINHLWHICILSITSMMKCFVDLDPEIQRMEL